MATPIKLEHSEEHHSQQQQQRENSELNVRSGKTWKLQPDSSRTHVRGRVRSFCGGVVCVEVKNLIHKHSQSYANQQEKDQCIEEYREKVDNGNRLAQAYTNCWRSIDATTCEIKLDADFTDDLHALVKVSKEDMERISPLQWGAKRIGQRLFAFHTKSVDGSVLWLHDHLLTPQGQVLQKFTDDDSLNCVRSNLVGIPMMIAPAGPAGPAQQQQLEITIAHRKANINNKSGSGTAGINFQKPQKSYTRGRFAVAFSEGGQRKNAVFAVSTQGDESIARQAASDEAQTFRMNLVRVQRSQQQAKSQIQLAWTPEKEPGFVLPMMQSHVPLTTHRIPCRGQDNQGRNLGALLAGQIVQHCCQCWCLRTGVDSRQFEHFATQELAEIALQTYNEKHGSVNPWRLSDSDDTTIKITAKSQAENEQHLEFAIDNIPSVFDAMGKCRWILKQTSEHFTYIVNANDSSSMAHPAILIAYTLMKDAGKVLNEADFHERFVVLPSHHIDNKKETIELVAWMKRNTKDKEKLLQQIIQRRGNSQIAVEAAAAAAASSSSSEITSLYTIVTLASLLVNSKQRDEAPAVDGRCNHKRKRHSQI